MIPSEFIDAYRTLCRDGPIKLLAGIKRYLRRPGPRNRLFIKTVPGGIWLLKVYLRLGRKIHPSSFTDADPFKIITIDPDQIIKHTNFVKTPCKFGNVKSGNWDRDLPVFETHPMYQSIYGHFVKGQPWEKTELYHRFEQSVDTENTVWGRRVNSEADIKTRFHEIERLYESMVADGYRTQRDLNQSGKVTEKPHDAVHPLLNEIGVDIGRNGELYWRLHGLHRLSIAKVLDVDEIGVQVLNRHSEWQRTRNQVRSEETTFKGIPTDHPDLQDILNT